MEIITSCPGPSLPVLPPAYRPFSPLRKMGLLPARQVKPQQKEIPYVGTTAWVGVSKVVIGALCVT